MQRGPHFDQWVDENTPEPFRTTIDGVEYIMSYRPEPGRHVDLNDQEFIWFKLWIDFACHLGGKIERVERPTSTFTDHNFEQHFQLTTKMYVDQPIISYHTKKGQLVWEFADVVIKRYEYELREAQKGRAEWLRRHLKRSDHE